MAYVWIDSMIHCPNNCDDGKCPNCGGTRKEDSGAVDTRGKAIMIDCQTCNGSGNCTRCGGNGQIPYRERVKVD